MLLPLTDNLSRFEICLNHMFGQELPPVKAGQKNRWLVAVFAAVCALRWPSYNESSSLQKRAKFEAKYIVNHD